jgi:hypothetical protein
VIAQTADFVEENSRTIDTGVPHVSDAPAKTPRWRKNFHPAVNLMSVVTLPG